MSSLIQCFAGMRLGGRLTGTITTHIGFSATYLCGSGCIASALVSFFVGNHTTRQAVSSQS